MEKPKTIQEFEDQLSPIQKRYLHDIRALILTAHPDAYETLFANQPYYSLPQYQAINFHRRPSIMLAIFKDHLNVFALENRNFRERLSGYRFTEKHTMQIGFDQELDKETLVELFFASLDPNHSS
jgi:hypothetical protein